jgi:hypothetical protein
MITTERIENFLKEKEIIEKRAVEIAKRMSIINPGLTFLRDVERVVFYENGTTVGVITSGWSGEYYEEEIVFPVSYLSDPNWEEQYDAILEQKRLERVKKIEEQEKRKIENEIKLLQELKAKYPNL